MKNEVSLYGVTDSIEGLKSKLKSLCNSLEEHFENYEQSFKMCKYINENTLFFFFKKIKKIHIFC